MALSGLEIYKHLPKTNCKECGFATCLAFAMQLASKKVSLDKCPHVTKEAKEALESASQPPVKLVTIGTGEYKIEIGNETVMFRHDQKFFHPCGIGFVLEDTLTASQIDEKIGSINAMAFERVGQTIRANFVCVKNSSGDTARFVSAVKTVVAKRAPFVNLVVYGQDPNAVKEAASGCRELRPLIGSAKAGTIAAFCEAARELNVPLAITADSVEEVSGLAQTARQAGVDELVLDIRGATVAERIESYTLARRMALKKNCRTLGYPTISFTHLTERYQELAEAISYVAKYAGLVAVRSTDKDIVIPLLTARQDIYTDPQKPVQVESKVYEVGKPGKASPVLITTNFSITYFTVLGEVESSKVPSYLIPCDTEGMSVLTAWAAEKFTAESITAALKKFNVEGLVDHKSVIIPGYIAVMSGKLEEESGWKVSVGPKEASGIPNYLKAKR